MIRFELMENELEKGPEELKGEEEFMDCIEPVVLVPDGIAVVAMDLQDGNEEKMVQMVRTDENDGASCLFTLDSGADTSVLPKTYAGVGQWSEGSKQLRMIDAQGRKIEHNGIIKAKVRTMDSSGKQIELVHSTGDGLDLRHEEKQVSVPISNERNSLQFTAHIYVIDAEEIQRPVKGDSRVFALRGTPSKHIQDLEMAPGLAGTGFPMA